VSKNINFCFVERTTSTFSLHYTLYSSYDSCIIWLLKIAFVEIDCFLFLTLYSSSTLLTLYSSSIYTLYFIYNHTIINIIIY